MVVDGNVGVGCVATAAAGGGGGGSGSWREIWRISCELSTAAALTGNEARSDPTARPVERPAYPGRSSSCRMPVWKSAERKTSRRSVAALRVATALRVAAIAVTAVYKYRADLRSNLRSNLRSEGCPLHLWDDTYAEGRWVSERRRRRKSRRKFPAQKAKISHFLTNSSSQDEISAAFDPPSRRMWWILRSSHRRSREDRTQMLERTPVLA